MKKEQAMELVDQIVHGVGAAGFRAHQPKIQAFGTKIYQSVEDKQCELWACIFREMADALYPLCKQVAKQSD